MLEALHITNFQSHEDSFIEFHPGVNAIVAPSRYGKSSILRNLFWIFENKPTGDKFRSRWGGDTTGTAYFENGSVSRVRAGSDNSYILTTEAGTQEYTGFGQAVPDPVAAFINMDRVNYQRQLDRPFMLDWTARERGAYLNEITNLEIIDRSISNIKKTIAAGGKQESYLKASIENCEKKLEEYVFLGDLEKTLKELECLQSKVSRLTEEADSIMALVEKIEASEKRIAGFIDVDGAEKALVGLGGIEKEIAQLRSDAGDVKSVISDIEASERIIRTKKEQLEALEKEFQANFPDICPLCGK